MKIEIFGNEEFDNSKLKYAIIFSKYKSKWIYVKHKERSGWVVPSGHREENENIFDTAKRELYEETGAMSFSIEPLFYYSIESNEEKNYGKVFYARVEELGILPNFEIESHCCPIKNKEKQANSFLSLFSSFGSLKSLYYYEQYYTFFWLLGFRTADFFN